MKAAIHAQRKVFTVGMHHQRVAFAGPSDNVCPIIKGLDGNGMPRSCDAWSTLKTPPLAKPKDEPRSLKSNEIEAGVRGKNKKTQFPAAAAVAPQGGGALVVVRWFGGGWRWPM